MDNLCLKNRSALFSHKLQKMLETRLSIFPMDGLHAGFLGAGHVLRGVIHVQAFPRRHAQSNGCSPVDGRVGFLDPFDGGGDKQFEMLAERVRYLKKWIGQIGSVIDDPEVVKLTQTWEQPP